MGEDRVRERKEGSAETPPCLSLSLSMRFSTPKRKCILFFLACVPRVPWERLQQLHVQEAEHVRASARVCVCV